MLSDDGLEELVGDMTAEIGCSGSSPSISTVESVDDGICTVRREFPLVEEMMIVYPVTVGSVVTGCHENVILEGSEGSRTAMKLVGLAVK